MGNVKTIWFESRRGRTEKETINRQYGTKISPKKHICEL
jgi:hypothetical protein